MTPSTRVDPITASVVAGTLESIADEMAHKLTRMSYSSIIRESEDFGCALLDADTQQLAESRLSTPLQAGPIPGYVRGVLRRFDEIGGRFEPGDVVMHNHTYYGASHGPDVGFIVPVFLGSGDDTELIGYSVTTAHHLDIGALSPGSCGIVDAPDAYAEGLQFNAIKVYERGQRQEWVWRLLRDNIRAADLVVGDMEAQIAAARIGADRMLELVGRFGRDTLLDASADLLDYSERMLRNKIAELPDGTYRAEGTVDGFLDHPDPRYRDLKISVALTVAGDEITVDLAGTDEQIDLPLNMPFVGTVDIAIYVVVRSILLDSARTGHVPANSGLYRPITITAPEGTLVNPRYPAPVIARFCPGNVLAATVMQALSEVVPTQVSAGIGNLKVVAYSGLRPSGDYWVYMDITEGSYGGRYRKDGLDAVDTLYANTRNNPIEDIEAHYPLRVGRYELSEMSAGPGVWRGGYGSVRDIEFREAGGFSMEGDGNTVAPAGLFGGRVGTTGQAVLNPGASATGLPSMSPYRKARAGDVLRTVSPSGGGYGDPLERDPSAVLDDVLDGLVTMEAARDDYGVVIGPDFTVDLDGTERLRRGA
ncbi:hydantoinase B/oxoprolinase family protein [Pseudonocardia acaciae]|uniref:hydantoinase B/oxoprolinase family protein n=1 Tax=Pseudonocardia acaciae TaxID=551276 RepID=UPI00056CA435|nr:hydantoinase B/oxoprolinase family protein [Pseudonocardia acaciae]